MEFRRANLAKYKAPKRVEFTPSLPKSALAFTQ
jgi:hypothetical protein